MKFIVYEVQFVQETVTVADDIFPADRTSGPDSWAGNDLDTIQQELATQNFETV